MQAILRVCELWVAMSREVVCSCRENFEPNKIEKDDNKYVIVENVDVKQVILFSSIDIVH